MYLFNDNNNYKPRRPVVLNIFRYILTGGWDGNGVRGPSFDVAQTNRKIIVL